MTDYRTLVSQNSSWVEEALEYGILSGLCKVAWQRRTLITTLRTNTDSDGYDVLLETDDCTRHVQLKSSGLDAATSVQKISMRLARKQSGCVVWAVYDRKTLGIDHFLWFGNAPGQSLPDLGEKRAKHTKANAQGEKAERQNHRVLAKGRFERVEDFDFRSKADI